jgi:hypothetical protein
VVADLPPPQPVTSAQIEHDATLSRPWGSPLAEVLGTQPAEAVHASPRRPAPVGHDPHASSEANGLGHASQPPTGASAKATAADEDPAVALPTEAGLPDSAGGDSWLEPDLAVAAMLRDVAGPPQQTDADVDRMFTRAMAWRECPATPGRMVEVNRLSLAYFRRGFPSSWGQHYLADRFGRGHHRRLPIPARSSTRGLDQPRGPPPAARSHR